MDLTMLASMHPLSSARRPIGATTRFGNIDVDFIHNLQPAGIQVVQVSLSGKDLALKPSKAMADTFHIIRGVDPKDQDRLQVSWSEFVNRHEVLEDRFTGKTSERDVVYEHSKRVMTLKKERFAPLFKKMVERSPLPNLSLKRKLMQSSVETTGTARTCNVAREMAHYPNLSFDNVIRHAAESQAITMALGTAKSWIYKPAAATEDLRYKKAVQQAGLQAFHVVKKAIGKAPSPDEAIHKSAIQAQALITSVLAEAGVPEADRPKASRDALIVAETTHNETKTGFDYKQFETLPQALEELKAWATPAKRSRTAEIREKLEPKLLQMRDALQPHLQGIDAMAFSSPTALFKMPFFHFTRNNRED